MNETVEYFGTDGSSLIGIFHHGVQPHTHSALTGTVSVKPAILLWNVGISNRTGPQRQYVELARNLTNLSFDVLRFDIGGLGESQASARGQSNAEQEIADIQAAMDHLQNTHHHQKFILIGFCSSANSGHPTMVRDPRVAGAVLIDGYGYKTRPFHFRHLMKRVASPVHWLSRIRRIARGFQARMTSDETVSGFFADFPPREQIEQDILKVVDRGVLLLYIYSGGIQSYFNHQNQFWEMFPLLTAARHSVSVAYHEEANHLFMYEANKSWLLSAITNWIIENYATDTIADELAKPKISLLKKASHDAMALQK
jgi:Serine aminopeptidase, S33